MNLAWAEIYLCLGALFSTFSGMGYRAKDDNGISELYKADVGDVEIHRDLFFPTPKDSSKEG